MEIKHHATKQLMCQKKSNNENITYHNLWATARVVKESS